MEVIRDATWEQCMASAMKMYRVKEPDDRCYHLADATWKCKMSYKKHEQKKSDRQLIVLDRPPEVAVTSRTHAKTCQATTMTGKPCSFRAVCGDFAKNIGLIKFLSGRRSNIIPVYCKC